MINKKSLPFTYMERDQYTHVISRSSNFSKASITMNHITSKSYQYSSTREQFLLRVTDLSTHIHLALLLGRSSLQIHFGWININTYFYICFASISSREDILLNVYMSLAGSVNITQIVCVSKSGYKESVNLAVRFPSKSDFTLLSLNLLANSNSTYACNNTDLSKCKR